jgi:hypothetical protein
VLGASAPTDAEVQFSTGNCCVRSEVLRSG